MPPTAKGEETRERILASTVRVFNEKGFVGASLADILAATGLQKGGLYNHFESKEALALEAFDYAIRILGRYFRKAIEPYAHAADKLAAVVRQFETYTVEPPIPGGCIIMNTAIEADDTNPRLRERARQAMENWFLFLRNIAAGGVERGELKPDVDPDALASLLIATLEGGVMLSKLYGNVSHMRRASGHLLEYLEGIRR